jgi:hypothetical protein
MSTGVIRLKDRVSRRPCFPRESRLTHLRRRIPEICGFLRGTLRVALEMEELWLATRKRSETEVRVLEELALMRARVCRNLPISDLRAAYIRAKTRMPSIEVPSRLSLFRERVSLFRVGLQRRTRRDLVRFWIGVRRQFRRGQVGTLFRIDRIVLNVLWEIRLAGGFLMALLTAGPGGKANPEQRFSEQRLDICPVPPADTGG